MTELRAAEQQRGQDAVERLGVLESTVATHLAQLGKELEQPMQQLIETGKIGYGYQWWIPVGAHEGEFLARGVYGQYIYFDQPRGVLIVSTGADRSFRDKGVNEANIEMFRKIAQSL